MENLAKALVIAGSIVIAVLTVSLFTLMFRSIGVYVDETSAKEGQAELLDFNKGFYSYNKKLMYGSDVITVMNKAIDNNTKENTVYGDGYYVNIGFRLKKDIESSIEEKYKRVNGSYYDLVSTTGGGTEFFASDSSYYDLHNNESKILTNIINETRAAEPIYSADRNSYTINRYSGAEFKRRAFRCVKVDYYNTTRKNKRNVI